MKGAVVGLGVLGFTLAQAAEKPFGIQVVDQETGRGIPLIELRTVNDQRFITDNAGWIAFYEPGLMEREVWFYLSWSPGYSKEKDGFGFTGVRLTPHASETATVKLKRGNIAERLARTTGQGLFRDSELLGLPHPLPNLNPAGVMGQDSVQATPYQGKIFWLWGDTNVPQYPLGNFQTTGALTPSALKPEEGIAFAYFMEAEKPRQLRHMMPLREPGAVWLFGLLTVADEQGKEVLIAHYGRHKSLAKVEEQGIARFSDEHGVFERVVPLGTQEMWRYPHANAFRVHREEGDFFYFADPVANVRVPATLQDVLTPARYEALVYDEAGRTWRWQREKPPTSQSEEAVLLQNGRMPPHLARYALQDATSGRRVNLHNGSIAWNEWRKKFVLIGLQTGTREDPSPLGEVWYAEADDPSGPWLKTVKVASHPRYSYYNPVHHSFLDAEGGRIIYFEGTYSLEFSGNPVAPARYDYNEVMYRLDLADKRLESVR